MKHSEGFLKLVNAAKSRIQEVSVDETLRRLESNPQAKLVDVREDHEWDEAHAARSVHLGKGIIERDVEVTIPDKATEVILYCGGGYRSALAAGRTARDGLHQCLFNGWRLESMERSRRKNGVR
jgi:rhodanese-related sulfurtransferase